MFNEADVNRATDGKFTNKEGTASSIGLGIHHEVPFADQDGIDNGHYRNGWRSLKNAEGYEGAEFAIGSPIGITVSGFRDEASGELVIHVEGHDDETGQALDQETRVPRQGIIPKDAFGPYGIDFQYAGRHHLAHVPEFRNGRTWPADKLLPGDVADLSQYQTPAERAETDMTHAYVQDVQRHDDLSVTLHTDSGPMTLGEEADVKVNYSDPTQVAYSMYPQPGRP